MRRLAAGNWKMNGTAADLAEVAALTAAHPAPGCDMLLCPPATLIDRMARAAHGTALRIGGQDCHARATGAHTGDVSAPMLAEAGASYVILGHSERRADHAETDAQVRAKAEAAWTSGLVAVVCVGETEAERDAGQALAVVGRQVEGSVPDGATAENIVIAYEPVWAIGTGRTPTVEDVAAMHRSIRAKLVEIYGEAGAGVRILYGGSVKPDNAAQLLAADDVGGALVGGASLTAESFLGIVVAAAERAAN